MSVDSRVNELLPFVNQYRHAVNERIASEAVRSAQLGPVLAAHLEVHESGPLELSFGVIGRELQCMVPAVQHAEEIDISMQLVDLAL